MMMWVSVHFSLSYGKSFIIKCHQSLCYTAFYFKHKWKNDIQLAKYCLVVLTLT